MLRFLSRRGRNHQQISTNSDIKSQRIPTNKNLIQCRVILLDNSDISIELSVSVQFFFSVHRCINFALIGLLRRRPIDECKRKEEKKSSFGGLSMWTLLHKEWGRIWAERRSWEKLSFTIEKEKEERSRRVFYKPGKSVDACVCERLEPKWVFRDFSRVEERAWESERAKKKRQTT